VRSTLSFCRPQQPSTSGADLQRGVPEPLLTHSKGYSLDALPVTHQLGGAEMRVIIHGVLSTGEAEDIDETILPPGQMPHPPYQHIHSEFSLICDGTLEFYQAGSCTK